MREVLTRKKNPPSPPLDVALHPALTQSSQRRSDALCSPTRRGRLGARHHRLARRHATPIQAAPSASSFPDGRLSTVLKQSEPQQLRARREGSPQPIQDWVDQRLQQPNTTFVNASPFRTRDAELDKRTREARTRLAREAAEREATMQQLVSRAGSRSAQLSLRTGNTPSPPTPPLGSPICSRRPGLP